MKKSKPTLKQYLTNYQSRRLNKSTSGDLHAIVPPYQLQLNRIDDKIENIKSNLRNKVDGALYEAICSELDEVKSMEKAVFLERFENNNNNPEPGLHRSSIHKSNMLRSCLGQRASRNSKNMKLDAFKENLQPPPNAQFGNTLQVYPEKAKVIEQSEVHIKQDGLYEELYSIKQSLTSKPSSKGNNGNFMAVPPSIPGNGHRPSITNYLTVSDSSNSSNSSSISDSSR